MGAAGPSLSHTARIETRTHTLVCRLQQAGSDPEVFTGPIVLAASAKVGMTTGVARAPDVTALKLAAENCARRHPGMARRLVIGAAVAVVFAHVIAGAAHARIATSNRRARVRPAHRLVVEAAIMMLVAVVLTGAPHALLVAADLRARRGGTHRRVVAAAILARCAV